LAQGLAQTLARPHRVFLIQAHSILSCRVFGIYYINLLLIPCCIYLAWRSIGCYRPAQEVIMKEMNRNKGHNTRKEHLWFLGLRLLPSKYWFKVGAGIEGKQWGFLS